MSDFNQLLFLCCVVSLLYFYFGKAFKKWFTIYWSCRKLPSPPNWYPIIGHSLQFLAPTDRFYPNMMWATMPFIKEGICNVQLGPFNIVMLTNADTAKVLFTDQTNIQKSFHYNIFKPLLGEGLLRRSGDRWHSRRKLLTPTFHFKILDDFLPIFNRNSRLLIETLKPFAGKGPSFIYHYIIQSTLATICATSMGCDLAYETKEASKYLNSFIKATGLLIQRTTTPWEFFDFIFYRTKQGNTFVKNINYVRSFVNKVFKDRKNKFNETKKLKDSNRDLTNTDEWFSPSKSRSIFLDLLLEKLDSGEIPENEIEDEVSALISAGFDTTGSTIFWTLFQMGLNQHVQTKLIEEVNEVFGDSDRNVTVEDIAQMKYLDLVLKESFRILPAAPLTARELITPLKIGKHTIPAGTTCVIPFMTLHMNPEYFPDPYKFDPERFLPDNSIGRHPFCYTPFSAGPRNCIGQKYGVMNVKVNLINFFRVYKVTWTTTKPIRHKPEIAVSPTSDMEISIAFRKNIS